MEKSQSSTEDASQFNCNKPNKMKNYSEEVNKVLELSFEPYVDFTHQEKEELFNLIYSYLFGRDLSVLEKISEITDEGTANLLKGMFITVGDYDITSFKQLDCFYISRQEKGLRKIKDIVEKASISDRFLIEDVLLKRIRGGGLEKSFHLQMAGLYQRG